MSLLSHNTITIQSNDKNKIETLKQRLVEAQKDSKRPPSKQKYYGILGAISNAEKNRKALSNLEEPSLGDKLLSFLDGPSARRKQKNKEINPIVFNMKNIGTKWDVPHSQAKIKHLKNGVQLRLTTAYTHPEVALTSLANEGYKVSVKAFNESDGKTSNYSCNKYRCVLKRK